ncbi:MAG: hypothetical protein HUU23_16340 [Caldilineales bacterium]|nr:hypothetical protein [Caldilineales bacterium]
MDHIGILKHAFHTTLRHRALWILGFLWALVGGGGGGFGNFGNFGNGDNFRYEMGRGDFPDIRWQPEEFLPLLLLGGCLLLILVVAATLARYVLQAGVYRTLDQMEGAGVAPGVRSGWRQGWHRRTWRLFLQDLIVGIPLVFGILLLLALAASPLLLLTTGNDAAGVIGVVTAIGLFLGWLLLVVIVSALISALQQFWWRAAVIDDVDALTAIGQGWRLVRDNLSAVAIMWLLMLGIGLLFVILLIPVLLIVVMITALVAGGPGYLIYEATGSLAGALLWGIPVGLVVLILPLSFVNGLYLIFQSSVWNQVYTQLAARAAALAAPVEEDDRR